VPFFPWLSPTQPASAVDPKQQEIEDLRRRLEELEKQIGVQPGSKKKAE
jgi:hypothetical protein